MAKVVYNACYGGFGLSRAAIIRAREISKYPEWGGPSIKGDRLDEKTILDLDYGAIEGIDRHDPTLVQVVEELGDAANGDGAKLRIEEIPPNGCYKIETHDGYERVHVSTEWIAP